jgi:hypothetical protein
VLTYKEKVSLLIIAAIMPLKLIFLLNYLQIIAWFIFPNLVFDWNLVFAFIIGKIMYYEFALWAANNKEKLREIYKDLS